MPPNSQLTRTAASVSLKEDVSFKASALYLTGQNKSSSKTSTASPKTVPRRININFISNLPGTGTAIVKSQVKHHGQTTMVIMAEMTDEQNNLLAAITTTMFIAGHFNEIPREW